MRKVRIAISMRVTNENKYEERRDAIAHEWVQLLEEADFIPVLLPNNSSDIKRYMQEFDLDGIVLTGGNDIHPDTFKNRIKKNDNNGDYSLKRDDTEINIIGFAEDNGLPLLGICRGMQLVNLYYGGKIYKNEDSQSGKFTKHAGTNHHLKVVDEDFEIKLGYQQIQVNSFHNYCIGVKDLPPELRLIALCSDDNTAEAFYHESKKVLCMMWHPERNVPFKDTEIKLLKEFFLQKAIKT